MFDKEIRNQKTTKDLEGTHKGGFFEKELPSESTWSDMKEEESNSDFFEFTEEHDVLANGAQPPTNPSYPLPLSDGAFFLFFALCFCATILYKRIKTRRKKTKA